MKAIANTHGAVSMSQEQFWILRAFKNTGKGLGIQVWVEPLPTILEDLASICNTMGKLWHCAYLCAFFEASKEAMGILGPGRMASRGTSCEQQLSSELQGTAPSSRPSSLTYGELAPCMLSSPPRKRKFSLCPSTVTSDHKAASVSGIEEPMKKIPSWLFKADRGIYLFVWKKVKWPVGSLPSISRIHPPGLGMQSICIQRDIQSLE